MYPTLLVGSARRCDTLLDRLAAAGVDAVNVFHRLLGPRVVAAALGG